MQVLKMEVSPIMHSKLSVRGLTFAAMLAALYAALTLALPYLSYGPVQIRFSEALTVLPFLYPAATPGLFIGCLVANLISPYGLPDMICGSLATLLACLWTQNLKSRALAPLPPVLCNAAIVGAVLAFAQTGLTPAFWPAYAWNAFTVGLGELAACCLLGGVLLIALPQIPFFRGLIPAGRLERLGYTTQRT